ncbi:efflux RND transporter periplasmic adaptor subunit [Sphingomonas sp. MAH-20]|uniref:Efflux RND transporter periplasmic adaptor subunit n=1 Tax=Sphingomonas horti TaxID=2682842 RepID=A0A6I4J341_9SPHN|nr:MULTISPECIES: efflux RND transporter periplasmic adaptor subunit [Sphingomonas]MBA2919939.1 efflux RND transporter periplasmic adaptor subunit [Sphingomonas sp. CGMCC 1.13658]MVO77821.1 efflux RND transporter periplasmic adaptor subunit [Sphingomonas horti]
MNKGAAPLSLLIAVALLAGCGGNSSDTKGGRGGRGEGGTPEVGYVVVQPTQVALTSELAGRTVPHAVSEVRPQVSGVIQKRLFTEGSYVRAGQTLYQIDPSLYRASAAQAEANVAAAKANAEAARTLANRYKPLAQMQAVSQQEYTNAAAQARQTAAAVEQQQAALQTAKINLNFTRVPAPISGRIGRSAVTVGALVTANQADPLATIQQLDPIYVDIQQSTSQLLALRRSLAQGDVLPAKAAVHLKLEDGSDYELAGTIEFAEVVVDPNTGTVTLRASFPNPKGVLLPGMFVRAVFAQAIQTGAFLVPQQAVSRDPQGNATVMVVGPNSHAVAKTVKADRTQGPYWVVTEGLRPGDKIITQGLNKVRANQPVRAVPATTPQKIDPNRPMQGGGRGRRG